MNLFFGGERMMYEDWWGWMDASDLRLQGAFLLFWFLELVLVNNKPEQNVTLQEVNGLLIRLKHEN